MSYSDSTPNINRFDDNYDPSEAGFENANIRKLPPVPQRDFRAELRRKDVANRRKAQEDEEELLETVSNLEKEIRKLPPQAMKNFRALVEEAKENGLKGKDLADFITENNPANVNAASHLKETLPPMKGLLSETKEASLGEQSLLAHVTKEESKTKNDLFPGLKLKRDKARTESSQTESSQVEEVSSSSRKAAVNPLVREKENLGEEEIPISKGTSEDFRSKGPYVSSDKLEEKALHIIEEHAKAPLKPIKEQLIPRESSFPEEEIPLSPDDLAYAKEEVAFVQAKEKPPLTPFIVGKEIAEKEVREPSWAAMVQSNTEPVISNRESPTQVKPVGRFNVEHPDMPYINLMNAVGLAADNIQQDTHDLKTGALSQLKDIVEQIIRRLSVLEHNGKTDTIIILKHPPLFDGAQVVITSFSSATREFNLAFENLHPDAQKLINDNINSLRIALAEEGSVKAIHIVTTTTLVEHHLPDFRDAERREKEEEGRGKQQQEQEDETV